MARKDSGTKEPNSDPLIVIATSPRLYLNMLDIQPAHTFANPSPPNRMRKTPRAPISNALPTQDALYLFCNFSSYMRSPHEGADGVVSSASFRDTIRLLEHARSFVNVPSANVHVLHLKYRYHEQGAPFNSAEMRQAVQKDSESPGRFSAPVPQPFSAQGEPVLKIDYKNDGIFEPLPAQAVFQHMAKYCRPLPRVIVISYVSSQVTQNHLASMAAWASSMEPPLRLISPMETRLREKDPLPRHVESMSMYGHDLQ